MTVIAGSTVYLYRVSVIAGSIVLVYRVPISSVRCLTSGTGKVIFKKLDSQR